MTWVKRGRQSAPQKKFQNKGPVPMKQSRQPSNRESAHPPPPRLWISSLSINAASRHPFARELRANRLIGNMKKVNIEIINCKMLAQMAIIDPANIW
jgi:ribosomal protein L20